MPIRIQPTTLKYKDEEGIFHSADCVKGEKGDTGEQGPQGETGATGYPTDAQVAAAINAVVTNPSSPPLDRTLSSSSSATPADITGELKSAFNAITGDEIYGFTNGSYINTNVSIGETVSLTPIVAPTNPQRNNYKIVDATECDLFTINGTGGNAGRLWAFIDSSNKLICKSDNAESASNKVLVAPVGSAKLILNVLDTPGLCHKGIDDAFDKIYGDYIDIPVDGVAQMLPSSGAFAENGGTRTVWAKCTPGSMYVFLKNPGGRFSVMFTTEKPAVGVSYTNQIVNNYAGGIMSAVAPSTAKYVAAYVFNTSTDSGSASTMVESVKIKEVKSIQTLNKNINDVLKKIITDINTEDMWEIGSLGSNGENYERDYEIRTRDFIDITYCEKIAFKQSVNTRVCLYKEDKSFIRRDTYTPITDDLVIANIVSAYPKAKYIRFTLWTSTTAIEDCSNYSIAEIIMDLPKENHREIYEMTTVTGLHAKDKAKADVLKKQRTSSENYSDVPCKILFATDFHAQVERTKRMIALANAWGSEYIDLIINGGDTVETKIVDGISWYNDLVPKCNLPILNTVGNHDSYYDTNGVLTDKVTVYNTIIATVKTNVPAIVQPDNAAANGLNYYYYDVNSIRIIVLDCMYLDSTEVSWFETVLADAKTNSKTVIVVSHYNFSNDFVDPVDCLWTPKTYTVGGGNLSIESDDLLDAVKNFIDNDGSFVCWLCGHSHGDSIKKTKAEYGNQYQFVFPAFVDRASTVFKSDYQDDYNYDCLTYLAVDTNLKILRGYRIGANINYEGTEYHGFVLDYGNQQLLTWY